MSWRPRIGDRVIKNPSGRIASTFDRWGAGLGIGVVVEPPWPSEDGIFLGGGATDADGVPCVDVRWPRGRCFQRCDELLPAE